MRILSVIPAAILVTLCGACDAAVVNGRVLGPDGGPARDAYVQAVQQGGALVTARPSSDGSFRLRLSGDGSVSVRAAALGCTPAYARWDGSENAPELKLAKATSRELVLRVEDETGAPVADTPVVVETVRGMAQQWSPADGAAHAVESTAKPESPLQPAFTGRTDSRGELRLKDVPVTMLRASVGWAETGWITRTPFHAGDYDGKEVVLRVGRPASVTGRVTGLPPDAKTPDSVSLQPVNGSMANIMLRVSREGTFATENVKSPHPPVVWSPGPVQIAVPGWSGQVEAGEYTCSVYISRMPPIQQVVNLRAGANDIEIAAPPCGKLIVAPADGEFPADSRITVRSGDWSRSVGRTEATSAKTWPRVDMGYVEPGRVSVFWYSPSAGWDKAEAVIEDGGTTVLELQARPGGSISGMWPDEPLEKELEYGVHAYSADYGSISARVEISGEFRFTNLPPGKWTVSVSLGKGGPSYQCDAEVEAGQHQTIVLRPTGGRLSPAPLRR